jgi:hypothetical protein
MKKLILIYFLLLSVFACKKAETSPEGPTDVRIRNISVLVFHEVVVSTSEYPEDIDTIGNIAASDESDYFRFKKAYPKAEISAMISINDSLVEFSTGKVDYTYMQYLGRDRITYEVNISDMNNKKLEVHNVILDEALILK